MPDDKLVVFEWSVGKLHFTFVLLTLILLTWRIWRAPNNASR